MSITDEGLKQAAKAVADIAPAVIGVAAKIASFVTGLGGDHRRWTNIVAWEQP